MAEKRSDDGLALGTSAFAWLMLRTRLTEALLRPTFPSRRSLEVYYRVHADAGQLIGQGFRVQT